MTAVDARADLAVYVTVAAIRAEHAAAHVCPHEPRCPKAEAVDHDAAKVVVHDHHAGYSVLCNHVVVWDDTGETLPDGTAIAPHRPEPQHRKQGEQS